MLKRRLLIPPAAAVAALAAVLSFAACIEPPPRIPAIPASGLAVRVFAFGAFAQDALQNFEAVKQNNPSFSIVPQGGDGEILIGIEQDTGACVEPTALCSLRVSWRVKNALGQVVRAETELDLVELRSLLAHLREGAQQRDRQDHRGSGRRAQGRRPRAARRDRGALRGAGGAPALASATPSATPLAKDPKGKKPPTAVIAAPPPSATPPAKPAKGLCAVGSGPPLPSEEAERRVGQVEALKRLGVIEPDEFDCLRKAFLARL